MNKEKWVDIKGYEGLYQISSFGRVSSLSRGLIMSPFDNRGYLRVQLYKDGIARKRLIHVLVAENFLEDRPFPEAQVNHIDFNKHNNHVDNLEWCSGVENVKHAIDYMPGRREALSGEMSKLGKKYGYLGINASKKPVIQIALDTGEPVLKFDSAREAARVTGSNYRNISQVCKGQRKSHNGFGWVFAG